ncbi:ribonuclease H family protein [Lapillicoccus jejuensis]|uniref:ribonuclease H n=1 Tax=Lapillicoccus jejuensis TaxID=402171 RepID=A0A542E693_9MICO|nr:ribonuclease H [Lapillicoccus jejuensis]TQJ10786.1 ribonuclease HI [Lapillicoccus jejuensis]
MPFPAKYAGTCKVCSRPIAVGEPITSASSGKGYVHEGCAQGALDLGLGERSTPTAAAPAAPATVDGDVLRVWTDGACSGNPGPGGWAWATQDGRQGSGGAAHTTNQRMEIQAASEAVRTLTQRPILVVSDSTYVVNCFRNRWWQGWLAKGWVNASKKPVANRDLWEPLIAEYQRGGIDFTWVKGHSGDPMNDLVDQLAVEAGRAQR